MCNRQKQGRKVRGDRAGGCVGSFLAWDTILPSQKKRDAHRERERERERDRERERERDTETERGFSNCLADGWENITAAGRRGVTRGDRLLSILHGIFVWEDLNCNQRSKGMLLSFHIRHLGTGE